MSDPHLILFDEIPLARDAIDEETGLPIGPVIDDAVRSLLEDRRLTDRRLGTPLVSLDLETVSLSGKGHVQTVADLAFEDTAVGRSRAKPMTVAGDLEKQAAICAVLDAAGVPTARSDMPVHGQRAVVGFVIESPRELSRLHDAMKALKDAALDVHITLALDSAGYLHDPALIALSGPADPFELELHEALLRNAAVHDEREDMSSLDRLGSMLDMDARRRQARAGVYRCRDDGMRHLHRAALAAALPERSGFDHRTANQAPRSQRRKRR